MRLSHKREKDVIEMSETTRKIIEKLEAASTKILPELNDNIPYGDMPGDKIEIGEDHIKKAKLIFEELLGMLKEAVETTGYKPVISVCGGSGVGKSETASLISFYLSELGLKSYTLSGDNYPLRIPQYNDAERLRIFRNSGLQGMIESGEYTKERYEIIHENQLNNLDASKDYEGEHPWYSFYIDGGCDGLSRYLGTENEINFSQLNAIIQEFKQGKEEILLKRMGRTDTELWYDAVDFTEIDVLVIEWTHGNNDNLEGVDIPILLNSTPEETLEHRRMRNRDGGVDSPFIMRVLELEQKLLATQAKKAKIIISKKGERISYEQMNQRSV